MQNLHSYWRMEYIEAPKPLSGNENLFSEIPKNKNDKEVYILYRSTHSYILLNTFPYNAGHLLIAPYKEANDLKGLNPEERVNLFDMIIKAQDILTKAIKPQGFNIGFNLGSAAGAGIPNHIHCHVVPRWQGDTNFMPVLGQTKVLPQSLDTMWERLRQFA